MVFDCVNIVFARVAAIMYIWLAEVLFVSVICQCGFWQHICRARAGWEVWERQEGLFYGPTQQVAVALNMENRNCALLWWDCHDWQ